MSMNEREEETKREEEIKRKEKRKKLSVRKNHNKDEIKIKNHKQRNIERERIGEEDCRKRMRKNESIWGHEWESKNIRVTPRWERWGESAGTREWERKTWELTNEIAIMNVWENKNGSYKRALKELRNNRVKEWVWERVHWNVIERKCDSKRKNESENMTDWDYESTGTKTWTC